MYVWVRCCSRTVAVKVSDASHNFLAQLKFAAGKISYVHVNTCVHYDFSRVLSHIRRAQIFGARLNTRVLRDECNMVRASDNQNRNGELYTFIFFNHYCTRAASYTTFYCNFLETFVETLLGIVKFTRWTFYTQGRMSKKMYMKRRSSSCRKFISRINMVIKSEAVRPFIRHATIRCLAKTGPFGYITRNSIHVNSVVSGKYEHLSAGCRCWWTSKFVLVFCICICIFFLHLEYTVI